MRNRLGTVCGVVLAAALALGAVGLDRSVAAPTHRDPCHAAHACPSDHHTYLWNGLSCTSYADERLASDRKVVVVGGRKYWCHKAGAAASTPSAPRAATGRLSVAARKSIPTSKARSELARVAVRAAASMSGYSRDRFGSAWKDVDGNGCDTRNDILRRDLTRIAFRPDSRCTVASGVLRDPYTGKTIRFKRGVRTSIAVQIDHVVALADAWRTGAAGWTPSKRIRYANDPLVLLAVDGPANEAKGDSDASEWVPSSHGYDCTYAKKQIAIKHTYGLWVTPAEKRALGQVLTNDCGSRPTP